VLRKLFSVRREPLTGAPAVRRLKSYSAQSGYVYQYYFEGHRPFQSAKGPGTEYVFSASPDRKRYDAVTVCVDEAAVEAWQAAHQRELSSTERYAIAKMALFQAFDERVTPDAMRDPIRVRNADLDAIVQNLEL
jgi:hypothetical protein